MKKSNYLPTPFRSTVGIAMTTSKPVRTVPFGYCTDGWRLPR